MKRNNYISWDDYFISIAYLTAQRSKDPSTQTGAVIVLNNKIVGCGYNGFPNGCSDDDFPWEKNDDMLKSKYTFVVHAEVNSILNSNFNMLKGSSIYTTLFPCHECAKSIIQVGIKNIYYSEDINPNYINSFKASKMMFDAAGIKYIKLNPFIEITLNKKNE